MAKEPSRAKIEAQRGILRDGDGRIVRSKEWIEERIAFLQEKIDSFDERKKNAQEEIKQRKEELKGAPTQKEVEDALKVFTK